MAAYHAAHGLFSSSGASRIRSFTCRFSVRPNDNRHCTRHERGGYDRAKTHFFNGSKASLG